MKKILLLVLAALCCLGTLASCGDAKDAFVPNGYQRVSHKNASYNFYVPNEWVPDLSTGVATAYVSSKDHSSVSFMAFEVNDAIIQASKGESADTDGTTATESVTTVAPETEAPATEAITNAATAGGATEVPENITTLEEYWDYYGGELSATFPDLTYSVEGESLMMAGMKAKKYVYTATVTGTVYEFMQVVALKEGTVYIFTYTSTEGEIFDSHLETVHEIIGYLSLK
jgi:hypothetical protein